MVCWRIFWQGNRKPNSLALGEQIAGLIGNGPIRVGSFVELGSVESLEVHLSGIHLLILDPLFYICGPNTWLGEREVFRAPMSSSFQMVQVHCV